MEFDHWEHFDKRKKADALVLPFWREKNKLHAAFTVDIPFTSLLAPAFSTEDFRAKEGETLFIYTDKLPEKRIILLGLGDKDRLTLDSLRCTYSSLTKACLHKKVSSLTLLTPQTNVLTEQMVVRGMAEGILLSNYQFTGLKSSSSEETEETALLKQINWIDLSTEAVIEIERISIICDGVYYTRDLVNGNADDVTPKYLTLCAQGLAKEYSSIHTTIFNKKRLEQEKMGLLLAVNRGSSSEPFLIQMEYKGNPHSSEHIILVGKGVTYDTGGLNLKPTGSMETMKCDMAGGAVCFGVMVAVAQLKLPVNITVLVPTTENSIDANSFKPGDVYTSYSGKTVEMTNSDAEGRLILADALSYACKCLQPTYLMDIATLTGAIEIALGAEASGLFCTQDQLAQTLMQAGEITKERVWQMPLYEEYKEKLKSDIADLKSWNGRSASSNVAATFLKQFVDSSIPWAHLDIAGTAYLSEQKKYLPKYATGVGVRLLVEWVEKQVQNKQTETKNKKRKK